MNYPLAVFFILSLIFGIIRGFGEISSVRQNPNLGRQPSKNLFTFLFSDTY